MVAADSGFVADWSADFGSLSANGDAALGAEEGSQGGAKGGAQGEALDEAKGGAQGEALDEAQGKAQDNETAAEDKVSSSAVRADEDETRQEERRMSTPGLIFTNEYGEQIEDSTEDRRDRWSRSPDGSGSEYETAEEWADGGQGGGWASADDDVSYEDRPPVDISEGWGSGDKGLAADWCQTVVSPENAAADRKCSVKEEELPGTQTQGGGAFDSDPFAETQGGGAFDSDPFAETQGGGAFDSVTSAKAQGGGAFDSDPFAETQGGGAFDSVTSAKAQGGGAFDLDPFAEIKGGDKGAGFEFDPFPEHSAEGGVVSTGDRGGWDTGSPAGSFPAAFSGTEGPESSTSSWQEVSPCRGSAAFSRTAGGIKDGTVTRTHKEPENSDMSEDEAANRRFGTLYRELETEQEVLTFSSSGS
ncbi:uncharacterized protein LOC121951152 [Plectropomus leopardus]|uniref:uncharacterized protein LOC121951152 n=1 Tax=Plectropomus leopardus TaxID=160734 RepID=UPI001C4B94B6|nr:uncharacterized protein LOC121951152 [Plectropomus leopardus]